jgi:hypothetical protein
VSSISTAAEHLALDAEHDPGDLLLGRPDLVDGLGHRQHARVRHGEVDRAAEHLRQGRRGGARPDVRQFP